MKKRLLVLLLCASGAMPSFAQQADDILGTWFTADNDSKVEITKKDGAYIGQIIWLSDPFEEDGKTPLIDDKNPNKELRNQPIQGMILMTGLKWKNGEWDDGDIYDPESGNTYSAMATMPDKNTIKLRGYMGFSLLGRTTTWVRAK
ncbi:DUF2147 domain-containing protein [Cryomorphaceae bacterium]|nr:DUF2147 domain-containing protein [Cryomorphaceae bacterium]